MVVTAKTKSGTLYVFNQVEEETRVTRNFHQELVLSEPVVIKAGNPLKIKGLMLNTVTYEKDTEVTEITTTPVVEVTIF